LTPLKPAEVAVRLGNFLANKILIFALFLIP